MDETLNINIDFDNDQQSFDYKTDDISYTIYPNAGIRTYLNFNFRWISFRIGYSPSFLIQDIDQKGETKVFKFQTDLFFHNWMQTLEYSKIKGFYVDNIQQSSNTYLFGKDEDYVKLPHLNTVSFLGRTQFKFNKNLSLKALYKQTEIQRKSAGSFITGLTYNYMDIRDKTSVQDLNMFGLYLNAGYLQNFIIAKRWYILLGISPGIGVEFNKVTTKQEDERYINRNTDLALNLFSQVGIGYNSKKFYSGLDLRSLITSRNSSSTIQFDTVRTIFRIYVGYRFKTPGFIRKSTDWIESKNPFKKK